MPARPNEFFLPGDNLPGDGVHAVQTFTFDETADGATRLLLIGPNNDATLRGIEKTLLQRTPDNKGWVPGGVGFAKITPVLAGPGLPSAEAAGQAFNTESYANLTSTGAATHATPLILMRTNTMEGSFVGLFEAATNPDISQMPVRSFTDSLWGRQIAVSDDGIVTEGRPQHFAALVQLNQHAPTQVSIVVENSTKRTILADPSQELDTEQMTYAGRLQIGPLATSHVSIDGAATVEAPRYSAIDWNIKGPREPQGPRYVLGMLVEASGVIESTRVNGYLPDVRIEHSEEAGAQQQRRIG